MILSNQENGFVIIRLRQNLNPDSIYKRIVRDFICGQYQFNFLSRKKISQALRHFDEVGISNELWDCLQDLGDYDFFFISLNNSVPTDVKVIEEII